ncbi:hypothetical protein AB0M83_27045 [Amycolatopsis sp. NPDC051106]|uniref:hypothetical protein n=1 Tax=unclassified Amycolatopsis TaxID=2618356 RepID=UPI00343FD16B
MRTFFDELAKKLAERWVTLLVLPGALFAMACWVGLTLGHTRALDWSAAFSAGVAALGRIPPATQLVLVIGALLAFAGVGLAIQLLSSVTRRLWLGQWPEPLRRPFTRRRRARWHRLVARRRAAEAEQSKEERTAAHQQDIDRLAARANRFALAEPGRPTWMGDRAHAVERIADDRYGLDLRFAWARLWLLLPDSDRAAIGAADTAFTGAVTAGTWAVPYLGLAVWWWPAAIVGVLVGMVGWARGRTAMADLTALTEATLDLRGRDLAVTLGVAGPDTCGPLTPAEGRQITGITRKGR